MKIKFGRRALFFSILTLITILTWIGFEVYRTAIKTTIPKVAQEQMKSLNPKINLETIESLKSNLSFTEEK